MSVVDRSVTSGPTLPAGHPFTTGATGVQAANYWSATTVADVPADAWFVDFNDGGVIIGNKTSTRHAWCVRGGMHADQY